MRDSDRLSLDKGSLYRKGRIKEMFRTCIVMIYRVFDYVKCTKGKKEIYQIIN